MPEKEQRDLLESIKQGIRELVKPTRMTDSNRYTTYTHIVMYWVEDSGITEFTYLYQENIQDVINFLDYHPNVEGFVVTELGREVARKHPQLYK